jgi:hypothetical protein
MSLVLENSGVELTTDYIKMKLLQEGYNPNPKASYSSENVLVSQYKCRKSTEYNSEQKAKYARNQYRTNQGCFICYKRGQRAAECYKNPYRENFKRKGIEKNDDAMMAAMPAQIITDSWYVDSGATKHMTCNKNWLLSYENNVNDKSVTCANNEKLRCEGVGKAIVMLHDKPGETTINDVAYVPSLATNVLSVNILAKKGLTTVFSEKGCHIYKNKDVKVDGVVFASATEESGMYRLNCIVKTTVEKAMTANTKREQMLWHIRFAHLSHQNMLKLRNVSYGMKFSYKKFEKCTTCIKGKQTSKPFSKVKGTRARYILGIVHTDICGPMSVPSWSGSKYFKTLIDDKTRKTFVYFLKHKSEVGNILKEFKAVAEQQSGKRIKII